MVIIMTSTQNDIDLNSLTVDDVKNASTDELRKLADVLKIDVRTNASKDSLITAITKILFSPTNTTPIEIDPNVLLDNERKQAEKLVRVIVVPQNPLEAKLNGVLISVGNNVIGTIRRFVPFNVPWHIEQVIYDHLVTKQYQTFYVVKQQGREITRSRYVPAYAVNSLPSLTQEELNTLAKEQSARQSIDSGE